MFQENNIDIVDWLPKFYELLKDNTHCYIMTNNKNITHYLSEIANSQFHFVKCLIWVKDNKIVGNSYMSQFEYIIMLRKGGFRKLNNNGYSDVLTIKNKKLKDIHGRNIHDTEKPLAITNILIENSSNEDDIVLDPFMGIGGCGVSAIQLNRKFIGCELNEEYYKVAKERIEKN